jgi:hypothetical protein
MCAGLKDKVVERKGVRSTKHILQIYREGKEYDKVTQQSLEEANLILLLLCVNQFHLAMGLKASQS